MIIHLQLKQCSEESLNMIFVRVDYDVVDLLVLQLSQHGSVVAGVGLSDVDLDVLGGGSSHQLLQSDQTILVFIQDCYSRPVEEHHHVLETINSFNILQIYKFQQFQILLQLSADI